MTRRVVITGLGLVTPVGNTVEDTWTALMSGRSGADYIKKFDTEKFSVKFACEVKNFDAKAHFGVKDARKLEVFVQYAVVAAREAFADSGLNLEQAGAENVGVYVGSGIGGLGAIEEEARVLLERGPSRISPLLVPRLAQRQQRQQAERQMKDTERDDDAAKRALTHCSADPCCVRCGENRGARI